MAASVTLAVTTTTQPLVGRGLNYVATLTGGTAWTNGASSNPLVFNNGTGVISAIQTVTNGNTCTGSLYLGTAANVPIAIVDSVNNVSAGTITPGFRTARTITGTTRYVTGGLRRPAVNLTTVVGNPNDGNVYYQVIAHNANGSTQGFLITEKTAAGTPLGNMNGCGYAPYDSTTFDASDGVTISWGTVTGATSYDVWRSVDGTTWKSLALGQATIGGATQTFSDLGGAATSGTLPSSDTTAIGSDANPGTIGSPYATLRKASTVAVSGDSVIVSGWTTELLNCNFSDGVAVIMGASGNRLNDGFQFNYNAGTGATGNANVRLPSHADVKDLTFDGSLMDNNYRFVIGWATTDAGTVDTNIDRCDFWGNTDCLYFETTSVSGGLNFTDCRSTGFFDNYNDSTSGTPNYCFNFTRHRFKGLATAQYTSLRGANFIQGMHVCRDCDFLASRDSTDQMSVSIVQGLKLGANARAILINTSISGAFQDLIGGTSSSLWLQNVQYDPRKSTTTTANISSQGTYITDPLIVPLAANVKSGVAFGPDANGATIGTATGGGGGTPSLLGLGL